MKKLTLITLIVCLAITACAQNKSKFFEWKKYDTEDNYFVLNSINEQDPYFKGAKGGRIHFKDKYYLESVIYPLLNECLSDEFISFLCTPPPIKSSCFLYILIWRVLFYMDILLLMIMKKI